ncbi:MAG: DUF2868 domain-containing protein [Desulfopila sp.]
MNSTWNYYDIIDLDYFLQQDDEGSATSLHQRDRRIYLDYERRREKPAADQPPRVLLAVWLADRRQQQGNDAQLLPGGVCLEAYGLLRLLLIGLGLFTGGSAGLAFFAYSGGTPVNVLHFLVLFVFSQLGLAALLLARSALVWLGLASLSRSPVIGRLGSILSTLFIRLLRRTTRNLSGERRLAMEASLGRLRASTTIMPGLLYWPLFTLLQYGALLFNLGLLSTTFFRITVSDLAFGWQSTLQFSAQSLHSFISWMARPWSWLLPEGIGYPSLAEIEGSHIILKEGIAHLQTPSLISWWPFLLLSLVVYGLTLRLLLLGVGWLQQRRTALHPLFTSPSARQVLRRMQTPVVSSQAPAETVKSETKTRATAPRPVPEPTMDHCLPVIVLIPDDIFDSCPAEELAPLLALEGYRIERIHRFMVDYDSDRQLPGQLAQELPEDAGGVVILQEGWMVPLVGLLSYIKELRQNLPTSPIMLRLVGRATADTVLTPLTDTTQLGIWREKLASLGDRLLSTRALIDRRTP